MTNVTKFAAIWVKKAKRQGFWRPISSKIELAKEKERGKRKSEEEEKSRGEKSNGCTLRFYNGYFGRKKKLFDGTEAIYPAVIRQDINWDKSVLPLG